MKLYQSQAEKLLRHNDGFTLLEMLFVISIIVLSLSLMITHPPRILSENQIEYQIKLLTSKIEFYQSQAIKSKKPVLLVFRKKQNDIKVMMSDPNTTHYETLYPLHLLPQSNLTYLAFDSNGNIKKFGTLSFTYLNKHFNIIFHIEQGRYRISYSN